MKKNIIIKIIICLIILIGICTISKNEYAVTGNYKIDSNSKLIQRIMPNTSATDFLLDVSQNIKKNNEDIVKLYQVGENGFEEVTSGIVKTNMRVAKNPTISTNSNGESMINADNPIYKTVVMGDINEDGDLNIIDLTVLIKHIVGLSQYTITDPVVLKAGDINEDESVNIVDITGLINYIVFKRFPENTSRQDYTMELSETSGTTTCPNTKTFTVTNPTGGTISASSSNEEIATVEVEENTIIVNPIKQGTATITVTSEETSQYKEGTATYTITVNKGAGYVTLSSTEGTVIEGQTSTFSVLNKHGNQTNIKVTNANVVTATINNGVVTVTGVGVGTTTIVVTAPANESYNEASATYTVTCIQSANQQNYTMELSETSGTTTCPNTKTFTVTNPTGGTIRAYSSNNNIATVSVNNSTITITPAGQGTATITVTSDATNEYKAGTATYSITVNKGNGYITLSETEGTVLKGESITFNITSKHGSRTRVYTSNSSIVNTSINGDVITVTGLSRGTTTIIVTAPANDGFTEASATYTVTVTSNQQNYTMNLSETSGTTTCPNTKTFTVTNPTGGTIRAVSSNNNIATASVSGSTITVTPVGQGTTTITVTSDETDEYKAGTATYTITVNKGTGYITISQTSGNVKVGQTTTFNVTSKHGNQTSIYVANSYVASATINNGVVTVTGLAEGTTTIMVTAPENSGFTEASATYTITVNNN